MCTCPGESVTWEITNLLVPQSSNCHEPLLVGASCCTSVLETVRERQRSGERHREARNRRIDGKTDRLIGRETHIVIMTEIIQDGRAGERALRAP